MKEQINCGESDVAWLKEEHEARFLFFFITTTNLKLVRSLPSTGIIMYTPQVKGWDTTSH